MSSSSGDLQRLLGLFQSGALTEEEFKAAKDATIKRHAQPVKTGRRDETEVQQLQGQCSAQAIDISGFAEDALGRLQRQGAYGTLETIVRNVQQFPGELRYRRLRLSNERLQSRLFCVPGVMGFLTSLGFTTTDVGADYPVDEYLVLPSVPQPQLLVQALEAISYLRRRDEDVLVHAPSYTQLRQSLRLEVRRERCQQAKTVGELRSYIAQEFASDDAGDGLYTSLRNIDTLRTVITNMVSHPTEQKYRKLRLSNKVVYRSLLQQRGAIELLMECAGAKLVDEAGETVLVFRAEGDAMEGELQYALRVLDEVEASVRTAREELQRREYEEAKIAMRTEMLQARRANRRQQYQCENEEDCPASGATIGGEEVPRSQGQRVPLKEAVKILMGKGNTR